MKLFLVVVAITIAMSLLHEMAHAITAIAFGAHGSIGTNTVRIDSPLGRDAIIWYTAAGPLLTLALALAAFRSHWHLATSVVFVAFAQRTTAAAVSLTHPNDEARLSMMLGFAPWLLFAVTVTLTATLLIVRIRAQKSGWRWLAINWAAFSVGISIMVIADDTLPRMTF